MTAEGRLAELDSARRRREGEQFTERSGPVERQQFRPMRATVTDKNPMIAVNGSRGDVSVSTCESARCLNNHEESFFHFLRTKIQQEQGPQRKQWLNHSRPAGWHDLERRHEKSDVS